MFPSPYYNPSWYDTYWLTERRQPRRPIRAALRRFAAALTAPRGAPHSRADARVPACQTWSVLLALPPI